VLRTDEVHLWVTRPAEAGDPDLLRRYYRLLNPAERAKHDRYRFEKRRNASLVTRALVRTTLSHYCPEIAPSQWAFVEVSNGRPEIIAGQAPLPLRFNLSRSEGLIVCAVTLGRAIGVDVEFVDPDRNMMAIADRSFAPSERANLRSGDFDRFYSYWTLKEAYLKARGVGLSVPLNQCAFDFDGPGPIRIAFTSSAADDPAHWQFALLRPTPEHVLALAIERGSVIDLGITTRSVVPLRPEV
jgi:4'-phosphopantetheinyl transferase